MQRLKNHSKNKEDCSRTLNSSKVELKLALDTIRTLVLVSELQRKPLREHMLIRSVHSQAMSALEERSSKESSFQAR